MKGAFALTALLASHPFEVARVLIVNHESGELRATLRSLWQSEGLVGLYRGFVPRALHLIPLAVGASVLTSPKDSFYKEPMEDWS